MNTSTKRKYFQAGLALSFALLLCHPLPASAFPQNGGGAAAPAEADKTSGITMQTVSGKVAKAITSGSYTYVLVEGDGGQIWVALPKGRIKEGNEITCQPGMVMNNFTSTSLNHTFKHIVFSSGLTSFSAGTALPDETQDEAVKVPKIPEPEDWRDL
jgi:hypothetical protein